MVLVHLSIAYTPETITVWTDKSQYSPGDTGTLYITFYNNMGRTLAIDGITVVYESWRSYDSNSGWQGNQTIVVERAFVTGEVYYNSTRFLVPTDGRANSTVVIVTVKVTEPLDIGTIQGQGYVNVYQAPRYQETVVTLLTILLVLIIVCTAIISATMLISARRPQTTSESKTAQ
jgi:hypothetical protein